VQRIGHGLAAGFPPERSQVSAAMNYRGTIKAFHFHLHQTDCWTPGDRGFSRWCWPICGWVAHVRRAQYAVSGPMRPWQVLIPPGVAHGYKIIGNQDALLVYMTDQFYNPKDEGRLPTTIRPSITIGKRKRSKPRMNADERLNAWQRTTELNRAVSSCETF
jgi:dTDP-4-dehydrorhamnose 3,5-epimerase